LLARRSFSIGGSFQLSALLRSFSAGGETLSPAKFLEGLSDKIQEGFAWGSMEFKTLPPGKWSIARPSPQSSSCPVSKADSEFHPGLAGCSTRKPRNLTEKFSQESKF